MLDAGYPTTAQMIMASIAKLGFDIKDVKVLINSEPHPGHERVPNVVSACDLGVMGGMRYAEPVVF